MTKTNAKITFIFLLLALVLVACSSGGNSDEATGGTDSDVTDTSGSGTNPDSAEGSRGYGDDVLTDSTTTKAEPTRAVAGESSGWVDGSPADSVAIAPVRAESEEFVELAAGESADEIGLMAEPMSAPPVEALEKGGASLDAGVAQNSALTAGDVDDNAQWDDYLLYLRDYSGARVLKIDVSQRHQIRVVDNAGNPVLGAVISVDANGQAVATLRTHSNGLAYFFPQALPDQNRADSYTMFVSVAGSLEEFVIDANGAQRQWEVVHPAADQLEHTVRLDIQFLIDATGSMSDEIAQLKENIRAISAQLNALPSQPDVRFSMTVYRDQGDEYVSRTFDFTPNVEEFAAALAEVEADGGGDYPEDLNEGLSRAIHAPEWRVEETVSLIFLVADAPPHLDYGQENHYAAELVEASARGIKIYPIASSGLDEQGEYIFRQLAQYTGSRFLFLTYGAGGAGTAGTETTHEVEDYAVTSLDGLVVQIVEEELAFRTQQ